MNSTSVSRLKELQLRMKGIGVSKVFDSHSHSFQKADIKFTPKKQTMASVSFRNYPMQRNLKVSRIVFSEFQKGYKQAVFGLPAHNVDVNAQNKRILDESKKNSRLVPLALVTPKMSLKELESLIKMGFSGLKPYPEFYSRFRKKIHPSLYLTENMLKVSENTNVPIILHSVPDASTQPSLRQIVEMAQNHPKAKIILAHMGRGRDPKKTRTLCTAIKKLKNVHLSTSVTTDPAVFRIAITELGPSRVMFGSDFPWGLMQAAFKKIGKRYGSKEVPLEHQGWQYLTKKTYSWTNQEVNSLASKKARQGYERLIITEMDALISVMESMFKEGKLSEDGARAIFYDNANKLFKRRQ